jgi:hypothetical protein
MDETPFHLTRLVVAAAMLAVILVGVALAGRSSPPPITESTGFTLVPTFTSTPSVIAVAIPPTQTPPPVTIYVPAVPGVEAAPAAIPSVRVVGPEEMIFDWSEDACERYDLPDTPVRVFRDSWGRVQLLSTHYTNRRMVGPDLDNLVHECAPVMLSDYDPDPTLYNDREWIVAPYTLDGTTVYSLIHQEYQGHTHPNRCPSGQYRDCWFNTITFGVSTDAGDSYHHAPPPAHLVATLPYPYAPGEGPAGFFGPSNIVYHPGDGHYYVLFRVEETGAQPWGVCVMRTNNLADPASWRAWDGQGFTIAFIDPYRATAFDPAAHTCAPVSRQEIGRMSRSVTYNTFYSRFLLVGTAGNLDPTTGAASAGIYYSLSDDLIHWTPRHLILPVELPWTFACGDEEPIEYPAIVDHASPSRNFDISGQRVYLYFTRFHYRDCQGTLDHDLVRVPIEFE